MNRPPAINLKGRDPQQFNKLINENKIQLLEASKVLSNKKVIARVKPAVVYMETDTGSGSGIIIDANGYILTNAHVVADTNSATIKLADGRSLFGNVVGRDENIDVALVKIDASGLPIAALGDSNSVEQGDRVFAMGYPLGIEGDVDFKDGTLSRRQDIKGIAYLEISAQILPGNSGGPLVNQAGEVIGINTFVLGARKLGGTLVGETLKFALPINVAKNLMPQLKSGRNIITPKAVALPTNPIPTPQQPASPSLPPLIVSPQPAPTPAPAMRAPVPPQPPRSTEESAFEFEPQITIQPGKYGSDRGTVRISISKPFEQCLWFITQDRYESGELQGGGVIYSGGNVVREYTTGEYKYEISCFAIGYKLNKKTGIFKVTEEPPPPPPPPPKITAEMRIKPSHDLPELLGEFRFYETVYNYNSSGSLITSGGSPPKSYGLVTLKIRVSLPDNATTTNKLIFHIYYRGSASVFQTFPNIKNGDIIEINPFSASTGLAWSFSDNPDYLSLKIIGGSAAKDGKDIPIEF